MVYGIGRSGMGQGLPKNRTRSSTDGSRPSPHRSDTIGSAGTRPSPRTEGLRLPKRCSAVVAPARQTTTPCHTAMHMMCVPLQARRTAHRLTRN